MADIPSIVNGPKLQVRESKEYDVSCPSCSVAMRITSIASGALIKCPSCGNITWRPDFVPPWWSKTSRFALSLIGSFVLGVSASFVASIVYEKYNQSGHVTSQANPTSITAK